MIGTLLAALLYALGCYSESKYINQVAEMVEFDGGYLQGWQKFALIAGWPFWNAWMLVEDVFGLNKDEE